MLDSGDSTGIQLAAVLILLMLSAFFSIGGDCPDYGKQDAGAYSGRGW